MKEELALFKARSAIIDEDPTTSSSQSPISTSPPPQGNDAQAPSTPSAQGRTTRRTDESSTASS